MAGARGQVRIEGSKQYGRLKDITYDPAAPGKLYALSNFGNHLLVTNDNGASWSILYTFPDSTAELSGFKFVEGRTASFIINSSLNTTLNGVYLFNLQSNTIVRHYEIPNPEDNPTIMSYDISATGEQVVIHDYYNEGGFVGVPKTKLYYTNNYGEDWNIIYFSEDFNDVHVNNVAFEPSNASKIFVARDFGPDVYDGGLLISADAGNTWEEKLPGILLSPIAFNPTDSNDIIIGTDINGGLHPENMYRSADGGESWTIIPNDWHTIEGFNNIYKIAFDPLNPDNIIVLEEDVVAVSADNGLTWTNTVYENSDENGYYAGLNVSFNPFATGTVAISTNYYPQISSNYGITLSQLYVPFYYTVSVAAAKNTENDYMYYGAQGGVVRKKINSNVFNAANAENAFTFNPNKNYLFTEPEVPSRVYRFVAREDFSSAFFVSNDFGQTYTSLVPMLATDAQVATSDPQNHNFFYISYRTGESSDVLWYDITDPENILSEVLNTPGEYVDGLGNGVVTGLEISATDSNTLYLAQRDKFYISVDKGLTWSERINGLNPDEVIIIWDMVKSPFNDAEFMVATYSGIYKTVDAGLHWEHIYNTTMTQLQYSDLNPNVIVASNSRNQTIMYTIDGGQTWTIIPREQIDYIQFNDVECIFRDDLITAYFATKDLGIVSFEIKDLPLGTDQPELVQKGIKIYPNPSSDIVNVVLSGDVSFKKAVLYSMTGQKVMESESTTVNIKGLSNGLYILNVEAADGSTYTQKLIKD